MPDGKLDAYVACPPYVVRLTGDGTGGFTNPEAFNLGVAPLQRLDDGHARAGAAPGRQPAPLLAFQHRTGDSARQLCISYDLDQRRPARATPRRRAGPLAVGDLNGTVAGVPPDEIVTGEGGDKLGIFGFAPPLADCCRESSRTVRGGFESAAIGDLDGDGDSTCSSAST